MMNCCKAVFRSIVVALAVYTGIAMASSNVSVLWSKVAFTTENGDDVIIEMHSEAVSKILVTLQGHSVTFPSASYQDLKIPDLSKTRLMSSSGISGHRLETSYVLEFPLADPTVDWQRPEDFHMVQFVMEDGRLIERDIWENDKQLKLISQTHY